MRIHEFLPARIERRVDASPSIRVDPDSGVARLTYTHGMEQTEGDERRKWNCCPVVCCQCCCPGILDLLIDAGQPFQPDGGNRAPLLDSDFSARRNNLSSSCTQTEHQAQPEVGSVLCDYMRRTDLDRPSNSLERKQIARYARRLPSARVVQGHRVVDHQQVERPGPSPYIPLLAEIDNEPDTLR